MCAYADLFCFLKEVFLSLIYLNVYIYVHLSINILSLFYIFKTLLLINLVDIKLFKVVTSFWFFFFLIFLGFSGLPPLLGFIGKFFLMFVVVEQNNYIYIYTTIIVGFFFMYFYLYNIKYAKKQNKSVLKKKIRFIYINYHSIFFIIYSTFFIIYGFFFIFDILNYLYNNTV